MNRTIACCLNAAWIAMIVGCASEPSIGDRMILEGGGTQALGQKWNEGRRLVKEGTDMIDDGENQIEEGEEIIEEGQAMVDTGKDMIRKGKKMMKESEEHYDSRVPGKSLKDTEAYE